MSAELVKVIYTPPTIPPHPCLQVVFCFNNEWALLPGFLLLIYLWLADFMRHAWGRIWQNTFHPTGPFTPDFQDSDQWEYNTKPVSEQNASLSLVGTDGRICLDYLQPMEAWLCIQLQTVQKENFSGENTISRKQTKKDSESHCISGGSRIQTYFSKIVFYTV